MQHNNTLSNRAVPQQIIPIYRSFVHTKPCNANIVTRVAQRHAIVDIMYYYYIPSTYLLKYIIGIGLGHAINSL